MPQLRDMSMEEEMEPARGRQREILGDVRLATERSLKKADEHQGGPIITEREVSPEAKEEQPKHKDLMPLLGQLGVQSREIYDESTSTQTRRRNPLSIFGSALSFSEDEESSEVSLSAGDLIQLCDDVRASLVGDKTLGPKWDTMMAYLGADLSNERNRLPTIDFTTIYNARLDKLLSDILNPANKPSPTPSRFYDDVAMIESLQWNWTKRFLTQLFTIEQERYRHLLQMGRLRHIAFNNESPDIHTLWKAKFTEVVSGMEGNIAFELGDWWLNLACAHRDGIVGSELERPTKSRYGPTAVPLLTGKEEYSQTGESVYVKEGSMADMYPTLMMTTGKQIRILRGDRLKSPLAPKAGIRYDGLYILTQYGQRLNPETNKHRMTLKLTRVTNQRPIADLVKIPRPSELDEWHLYKKHEGEMIKQKRGDRGFLEWKSEKAQDQIEKERYIQEMVFQAELEMEKLALSQRQSVPKGQAGEASKVPSRPAD